MSEPSPETPTGGGRVRKAVLLTVAAFGGYLVWVSIAWSVVGDPAVFHYTAWLISHGAVPYRDIFDINFPGIYLVHLTVLKLLGSGDLAWRLFDLGWLGLTCGVMYLYCRPLGDRWSAAASGLLFAVHHIGDGAALMAARDFLLCIFLLGAAYGVARWRESDGHLGILVGAGLVVGAAMVVKPHTGLFWLICTGAAGLGARGRGRTGLAGAGVVLGTGLVVPALVLGWLAWRGGLGPFLAIFFDWTLPLYSQVRGARPLEDLVAVKWALLGLLGLLGAATRLPDHLRTRRGLVVAGVVYGFVHFALQFKGWAQYRYPLACFLCVLASPALAASARGWPPLPDRTWLSRRGVVTVSLAILLIAMADAARRQIYLPYDRQRVALAEAVARQVRALVPRGEPIQVMGLFGAHVLLKVGAPMPTRFITDFQFYLRPDDPRTQALRRELLAGLEARPPRVILVFAGKDSGSGFDRLASFPGLARVLAERYRVTLARDGYRIYVRAGA